MKNQMKRMRPTVTGTLQEKNGKFYLVLRIPDSTGKLHQKWVSTGLPVQGNQRRAKPAGRWPKSVKSRSTRSSVAG